MEQMEISYKGRSNYIHHVNTWWWGKTITLVSKDGYSTVELQFDDNYPTIAFIKGLSVFQTRRKEGYGTEIMGCCEAIAKKEGYTFLQLSVNKEQDWLVEWYKHLGFVIIMKDEHEFTMLKTIKQMNLWKPSDEQMSILWDALCTLKHENYKHLEIIKSLHQDLKKLKE